MRINPHITTTAALVLALGAAAPAAASTNGASPPVRPHPDEQVLTSPATPPQSPNTASATVQPNPDEQTPTPATASTPQVVTRLSTPNRGFDWGDAGIGAAGGLGLSLVAVGGALAVSRRHDRVSTPR
jgi:hypothetical protein